LIRTHLFDDEHPARDCLRQMLTTFPGIEVIPLTGGQGEVILKSGTRLEVSRRRMKDLVDTLEGPK
jgi:hypothetical protein